MRLSREEAPWSCILATIQENAQQDKVEHGRSARLDSMCTCFGLLCTIRGRDTNFDLLKYAKIYCNVLKGCHVTVDDWLRHMAHNRTNVQLNRNNKLYRQDCLLLGCFLDNNLNPSEAQTRVGDTVTVDLEKLQSQCNRLLQAGMKATGDFEPVEDVTLTCEVIDIGGSSME